MRACVCACIVCEGVCPHKTVHLVIVHRSIYCLLCVHMPQKLVCENARVCVCVLDVR